MKRLLQIEYVNDESTRDKDSSVYLICHDPSDVVIDPDPDHPKGTHSKCDISHPLTCTEERFSQNQNFLETEITKFFTHGAPLQVYPLKTHALR